MIPVGIWASVFPELTLPKLTGLILGLAGYRALVLFVHDRRTLGWALAAFFGVGLAIVTVGALGAGWPDKVAALQPVLQRLPRAFTDLPGAPDQGINPNQLAGALQLFLPLALALVGSGWQERRWGLALLALVGFGLVAGVLFLSQLRGGWLGGLVALAVLVFLRLFARICRGGRHGRTLLVAGLIVVCAASLVLLVFVAYVGPERIGAGRFWLRDRRRGCLQDWERLTRRSPGDLVTCAGRLARRSDHRRWAGRFPSCGRPGLSTRPDRPRGGHCPRG